MSLDLFPDTLHALPLARHSVRELIAAVQDLSMARDVETIQRIVRAAARRLLGADGATFVLRDGDLCHYVDEDAISPMWKGQRFPMETCISGWAMLNRRAAVIPDIYVDDRIPHDAYRPTFVKSLVMVPIRSVDPIGAIGNYWSHLHETTPDDVALLQALADSTAVAMANVAMLNELEQRVAERTADLDLRTTEAIELARRLQAEVEHRRRAEETVRTLSLTDELTGLWNRRGLLVEAESLCQRTDGPLALAFIDLDGLKQVNDADGHEAGDDLIRHAADLLAGWEATRVVGRWGGDEFVVVVSGDGRDVRGSLLAEVARHNRLSGQRVSMSVGVAAIDASTSLRQALNRADEAMYRDKVHGKQMVGSRH